MNLEVLCGNERVSVPLASWEFRYLALERVVQEATGSAEPLVFIYSDEDDDAVVVANDEDLFNMQESFKKGGRRPILSARSLALFLELDAGPALARLVLHRRLTNFYQKPQEPTQETHAATIVWACRLLQRLGFPESAVDGFRTAEKALFADSSPSGSAVFFGRDSDDAATDCLSSKLNDSEFPAPPGLWDGESRAVIFDYPEDSSTDSNSDLELLRCLSSTNGPRSNPNWRGKSCLAHPGLRGKNCSPARDLGLHRSSFRGGAQATSDVRH